VSELLPLFCNNVVTSNNRDEQPGWRIRRQSGAAADWRRAPTGARLARTTTAGGIHWSVIHRVIESGYQMRLGVPGWLPELPFIFMALRSEYWQEAVNKNGKTVFCGFSDKWATAGVNGTASNVLPVCM
jgi:hypothetical protein